MMKVAGSSDIAVNVAINRTTYGKLLRKTLPRPIRTEEDNERHIGVVEHLMDLGERIAPEQRELMDLL